MLDDLSQRCFEASSMKDTTTTAADDLGIGNGVYPPAFFLLNNTIV